MTLLTKLTINFGIFIGRKIGDNNQQLMYESWP